MGYGCKIERVMDNTTVQILDGSHQYEFRMPPLALAMEKTWKQ
jgi:hypothetical protein